MAMLSHVAKRLTVIHGTEQCTILLVEGAEPESLMSSIQSRFQLRKQFYLTEPDQSCLVPLTSALPDRLTLYVRSTDSATTSMLAHQSSCCAAAVTSEGHQAMKASSSVFYIGDDTGSFAISDPFSLEADTAATSERGSGFVGPPPRRDWNHLAPPKPAPWSKQGNGKPDTPSDEHVEELSVPLLADQLQNMPSPSLSPMPHMLMSSFLSFKEAGMTMKEAILDPDSTDVVVGNPAEPDADPSSAACSADVAPARSRKASQISEAESLPNDLVGNIVQVVNRFERLSTDLANERTMLAWHRTCLAAMRTALAFVAVNALEKRWREEVMMSAIVMSLVVIATAMLGFLRYQKVKQILQMKDPPQEFGRPSNKLLNTMVLLASIATALVICIRAWDRE